MEIETNNQEEMLIKEVSLPMFNSKGWIKFLGILMIVYGGLVALSIVGIIVAWLPIWLGVLLNKAANKIEQAYHTGNKIELMEAHKSLGTYFTIYGVVALIGIALGILVMIIALTTGIFAHLQDFSDGYY